MSAAELAETVESTDKGTLVRDATKSTDGWERRSDGKWYKTDYYKLHEQQDKGLVGMEVMERLFVGSFNVAMNKEWLISKKISRVLVLGANSGISVEEPIILRVLEVDEENIFDYFDQAIVLIKEALAEHEGILVVCKDQKTFSPLVIVAYLMAVMGWALNTAVERIQSIFKLTITGFSLFVLQRWEQVITTRRNQVTVEKKVIQSPPQTSSTTIQTSASQSSASREAQPVSSGSAVNSGSVYMTAAPTPAPIVVSSGPASVSAPAYAYNSFYTSSSPVVASSSTPIVVGPSSVSAPAYLNNYYSTAASTPVVASSTTPILTSGSAVAPAYSAPILTSGSAVAPAYSTTGYSTSAVAPAYTTSGYAASSAVAPAYSSSGYAASAIAPAISAPISTAPISTSAMNYSGFGSNSGWNGAVLSSGLNSGLSSGAAGLSSGAGYANWGSSTSYPQFNSFSYGNNYLPSFSGNYYGYGGGSGAGYSGLSTGLSTAGLSTGLSTAGLSSANYAVSYPTASYATEAVVAAPAVSYATTGASSAGLSSSAAQQMQQLQQQQQTTMVQTTTTRTGSVVMGDASWHSGGVYCHPASNTK